MADLSAALAEMAPKLRQGRAFDARTCRALGIIAAVMQATHGLKPFPSQLMGALALYSGRLVEMETGSGKTLTAALAAALAALAGEDVHVVTANDYLAARDHAQFEPFFNAMGLSTGLIMHSVPPPDRGPLYRARVIYASNKEIAFDYLRNRIVLGGARAAVRLSLEAVNGAGARALGLTMNGLPFAIVDEADSVDLAAETP